MDYYLTAHEHWDIVTVDMTGKAMQVQTDWPTGRNPGHNPPGHNPADKILPDKIPQT